MRWPVGRRLPRKLRLFEGRWEVHTVHERRPIRLTFREKLSDLWGFGMRDSDWEEAKTIRGWKEMMCLTTNTGGWPSSQLVCALSVWGGFEWDTRGGGLLQEVSWETETPSRFSWGAWLTPEEHQRKLGVPRVEFAGMRRYIDLDSMGKASEDAIAHADKQSEKNMMRLTIIQGLELAGNAPSREEAGRQASELKRPRYVQVQDLLGGDVAATARGYTHVHKQQLPKISTSYMILTAQNCDSTGLKEVAFKEIFEPPALVEAVAMRLRQGAIAAQWQEYRQDEIIDPEKRIRSRGHHESCQTCVHRELIMLSPHLSFEEASIS
ncbi:hypothetical protein BDV98DRAFT_586073 [Pterulicium gracile]|uniref:Uncharacterized protein n=1 Tax=Pterulicium gracile TaxID=1884261 RepID=A0A5C3Q6Q8_9AGAR|nr:hypothetical protein BDV98DRAFT_586073 [Pterula gracilis]